MVTSQDQITNPASVVIFVCSGNNNAGKLVLSWVDMTEFTVVLLLKVRGYR